MAYEKKWVVSLIEVNERRLKDDGFPVGREFSSLSNMLNSAIETLSPSRGLDLDCIYLLNNPQKKLAVHFLEGHSLPFHQYVVDRGEKCTIQHCEIHPRSNLIVLNDRR